MLADQALRRARLLDLGDQAEAAFVHRALERLDEAARRRLVVDFALQRPARHAHLGLGDFAPLVGSRSSSECRSSRPRRSSVRDARSSGRACAALRRSESPAAPSANALLQRRRLAGDDQRRAGVEQRDVAIGARRAPSSTASSAAALCAGSPPFSAAGVGAREAGLLRRDLEGADRAVLQFDDLASGRSW